MKVRVHITETNETYDRDMTVEEIAQAELDEQTLEKIEETPDDLAD